MPETLRKEHARRQAEADGFQHGWAAALERVKGGEDVDALASLVPTPRRNTPLTPAEVLVGDWVRFNDDVLSGRVDEYGAVVALHNDIVTIETGRWFHFSRIKDIRRG